MSLQGDRAELAAVLSTVPGVTGHEYRPRTLPPGTAWPLIERLDQAEEVPAFEATWRVVVILPAQEVPASQWFDAHHETIAEALAAFGYVAAIVPGLVQTDGGDLEAMMITVRREA